MTKMVHCVTLDREAEALDRAPYPGELGERILKSVSKEAWAQWLAHQTMLINEHRLSPRKREARNYLEQEMVKFLFEGGADRPEGFVAPPSPDTE
ncbi:MAG: oxidative damage protection protein [Pseudomonadota bacterium]